MYIWCPRMTDDFHCSIQHINGTIFSSAAFTISAIFSWRIYEALAPSPVAKQMYANTEDKGQHITIIIPIVFMEKFIQKAPTHTKTRKKYVRITSIIVINITITIIIIIVIIVIIADQLAMLCLLKKITQL